VRAYLLAFGLTSLMIGLPLLLAGEVGIGCTVTSQGATTVYSDCSGAQSLVFGGAALVVAAVIFFAGMMIPNPHSQYK
jgi:hypothetical protein